jgi:hypothetical protein
VKESSKIDQCPRPEKPIEIYEFEGYELFLLLRNVLCKLLKHVLKLCLLLFEAIRKFFLLNAHSNLFLSFTRWHILPYLQLSILSKGEYIDYFASAFHTFRTSCT